MSGGDKDGDPGRVLHLPHALTLPQHLRQGPLDGEVYNTRAASGSTKQLLWIIFVRSFKIWFWSDLKKRWVSVLRKACFFRDFFVFEVMKFFVSPTFGAPGVWPSYSWRDTLCMMFAWRCWWRWTRTKVHWCWWGFYSSGIIAGLPHGSQIR